MCGSTGLDCPYRGQPELTSKSLPQKQRQRTLILVSKVWESLIKQVSLQESQHICFTPEDFIRVRIKLGELQNESKKRDIPMHSDNVVPAGSHRDTVWSIRKKPSS